MRCALLHRIHSKELAACQPKARRFRGDVEAIVGRVLRYKRTGSDQAACADADLMADRRTQSYEAIVTDPGAPSYRRARRYPAMIIDDAVMTNQGIGPNEAIVSELR